MALLNKTLGTREDARNSEGEDDELEQLESDVMEMAQKILDYRATLPDQLRTTLSSVLAAQRPVFPNGLEPAPSGGPISDAGQVSSSDGAQQLEGDQEATEKIRLLKEKISNNVSAMPVVLKRMKECLSKIDKLDSYNGIVHPAFKRKGTS
ncbi:uncharacterized protein LOC121253916 [Juglans microcarpa x Juglans regia]|uniref:uncharacterized protein LOC121253916 n=1 Tax=Juglans microcarpa x Juglans regia TaxID=2249226 RepID=UPI001B7F1B5E|nr:uncharacterized protein LOC121253916 [Juglans microcarpa x Juglans regia]